MNVCSAYCTTHLTLIRAHRTIRQYYEVLFSILNTLKHEKRDQQLYDTHGYRDTGNRNFD